MTNMYVEVEDVYMSNVSCDFEDICLSCDYDGITYFISIDDIDWSDLECEYQSEEKDVGVEEGFVFSESDVEDIIEVCNIELHDEYGEDITSQNKELISKMLEEGLESQIKKSLAHYIYWNYAGDMSYHLLESIKDGYDDYYED